jgi:hypothetical protein
MKTLSLSTWEREALKSIMSVQRGDLARLRRLFRVIDVLELTNEEATKVGYKPAQNGTGPTWKDEQMVFDLAFEDADFALLAEISLHSEQWMATRPVIDMLTKIEHAKQETVKE